MPSKSAMVRVNEVDVREQDIHQQDQYQEVLNQEVIGVMIQGMVNIEIEERLEQVVLSRQNQCVQPLIQKGVVKSRSTEKNIILELRGRYRVAANQGAHESREARCQPLA